MSSQHVAATDDRSDDDVVLSLEDVSVHFQQSAGLIKSIMGKTKTVHAVDNISLDIKERDVVALVGESGCGKTTLGKTTIGLQRPTSGTIRYRGQDIWDAKDRTGDVEIPHSEIRRSLQIIHQDPGSSLNPNRKILKLLEEPLKRWYPDLDADDRRARIYGMLEHVGMAPASDFAMRYPHQLSGGEQQRTALVRALMMNPDVILADEAVSALDVSLRVETMDLMLDLLEQFDTSYVFVAHDLSNARYMTHKADGRIGIMYLGELVEIGPVEEIINNPKHPYTKALVWATPNINPNEGSKDVPLRQIDIPDAVDVPSGCRFHTRCPEARQACVQGAPEKVHADGNDEHQVACYREDEDDHAYWSSESIVGEGEGTISFFDDE